MDNIETVLGENRQGTPYTWGSNKKLNEKIAKYSDGNTEIDEDTAYNNVGLALDDILGERVDKWVKTNKKKLEKMGEQKAVQLYSKQVESMRKGLMKEFPQEAKWINSEYTRRAEAKSLADDAQIARDRVVTDGKLGLEMNEPDQAMLNDPNYQNPVGSTSQSIEQAQGRQEDLAAWKQ